MYSKKYIQEYAAALGLTLSEAKELLGITKSPDDRKPKKDMNAIIRAARGLTVTLIPKIPDHHKAANNFIRSIVGKTRVTRD